MPGLSTHVRGYYPSPIGLLEVRGSQRGIFSITFIEEEKPDAGLYDILQPCIDQLHAYFSTDKHQFHSLPLALHSTDFQLQVWEYLMSIPYGNTVTYGEIAEAIGHPKAVRAVGSAVGRNPLSILIPCHRVLPASGEVGEYAHGAWRKEWLLLHEKK
ncbi:cysteine methyltransferase [Candidatus Peregrinibacteria bacterium CG10_big_fil_rev_8_21_14_0_10_49_10]|nr:MAG: cysteine methyltransferase [Candidatus Peregrinibacteria bacterium CG10_big_fil_rev_8_21_14_0_10_49_10]